MLYTASYLESTHHQGLLLSISRSVPKGFKIDGKLEFLIPSAELLLDWKASRLNEAEYSQRYREQIKQAWQEVKEWLDNLAPKPDQTLLCWEAKGKFCHRNLIAKLVQKHRPDCFGGCDVIRVEMPLCKHCNSHMIPGLDGSFCPSCNLWFHSLAWTKP